MEYNIFATYSSKQGGMSIYWVVSSKNKNEILLDLKKFVKEYYPIYAQKNINVTDITIKSDKEAIILQKNKLLIPKL